MGKSYVVDFFFLWKISSWQLWVMCGWSWEEQVKGIVALLFWAFSVTAFTSNLVFYFLEWSWQASSGVINRPFTMSNSTSATGIHLKIIKAFQIFFVLFLFLCCFVHVCWGRCSKCVCLPVILYQTRSWKWEKAG